MAFLDVVQEARGAELRLQHQQWWGGGGGIAAAHSGGTRVAGRVGGTRVAGHSGGTRAAAGRDLHGPPLLLGVKLLSHSPAALC